MRAGAAWSDITPEPGMELAGYAARIQPSLGVHDPLLLRGLFLESDEGRMLWIHADLIGFDRALVERIRATVGARTRVRPDELVLSASHTHAGPPTLELLGCGRLGERGADYLDRVVAAAIEVADSAIAASEDVEVVEGTAVCRIALDRRHRERGLREDEVVALGFRRKNGEYVAVLANFAIHPVSLNYKNRLIGADLFGVAADYVRDGFPGRPVVLVTNGACGDLNPPVQGGDFDVTRRLGVELGEAIVAALRGAEACSGGVRTWPISASVRVESMDEGDVRRRAQQVRDSQEGADPVWAASSIEAADLWEQRMLQSLPLGSMELPVQIVDLVGRRFVCLGAEVLSKMDLAVKQRFGRRTSVVGYTNGNVGYLCPQEAHDEGGYEPDLAFIYYGTPKIARGAFERLLDGLT